MMPLASDTCYQCDGAKVFIAYDPYGLVRTESIYQLHYINPGDTWEIACDKCGLLYSRSSVTAPQHIGVSNG